MEDSCDVQSVFFPFLSYAWVHNSLPASVLYNAQFSCLLYPGILVWGLQQSKSIIVLLLPLDNAFNYG